MKINRSWPIMRFFKALAFMLGFFVLYSYVLSIADSYKNRDISIHQYQVKVKQKFDKRVFGNIILGDSRALAINYSNNKSPDIYNYSFSNAGGLYPYPYFLKKYLQKNAPPKRIIWSFIPLMLTDEWEIFQDDIAQRNSELERAAFLYDVVDMVNPFHQNVFWQNPLTSEAILKKKIDINYKYLKSYVTENFDPHQNQKLFNEETGGVIFAETARWKYDPDNYLENVPLEISSNASRFIEQFMDIAKKNAIRVYLFNMPIPTPIYQKRSNQGFYDKYFAFVNRLKEEYPDNLFINTNILHYSESLFLDESHLNIWGAEYFQQNDYPDILGWVTTN